MQKPCEPVLSSAVQVTVLMSRRYVYIQPTPSPSFHYNQPLMCLTYHRSLKLSSLKPSTLNVQSLKSKMSASLSCSTNPSARWLKISHFNLSFPISKPCYRPSGDHFSTSTSNGHYDDTIITGVTNLQRPPLSVLSWNAK